MSAKVVLSITAGELTGKELVFTDRTFCTVGRAAGCYLRLPNDAEHLTVSRCHCLFNIDPPTARVRDLGSRNGTFVNGRNIGQRGEFEVPPGADPAESLDHLLKENDEVRVGRTVFQVHLFPAGGGPGSPAGAEGQQALRGLAAAAGE